MLVGMSTGLSVEERSAEEELEGALVHLKAQQPVLLHRGGPQGLPGEHRLGRELLRGGTKTPPKKQPRYLNNNLENNTNNPE